MQFKLDKLCGIRTGLVRTDNNWKNWGFNELIKAIRKWTERNPIERFERSDRPFKEQHRREHIMQTHENTKTREYIYCSSKDHKPLACNRIQDVNERRKIIASKRLCFNCIGEGYRASNWKSQKSCMECKGHHHTSLCMDATNQQSFATRTEFYNPNTGKNLISCQRVKSSTQLLWLKWMVLLAEPY